MDCLKADSGTISGLPYLAFFQLYGARHDHLSVSYRWNYPNLEHFASKRKPTNLPTHSSHDRYLRNIGNYV